MMDLEREWERQKILDMAKDLSKGRASADRVLQMSPKTHRLEVVPKDQADSDTLQFQPEDFSVSAVMPSCPLHVAMPDRVGPGRGSGPAW